MDTPGLCLQQPLPAGRCFWGSSTSHVGLPIALGLCPSGTEWGGGGRRSICSENNILFSDTIDHRIQPGLGSYLLLNLASFMGMLGTFLPSRGGAVRGGSALTHHSLPLLPPVLKALGLQDSIQGPY